MWGATPNMWRSTLPRTALLEGDAYAWRAQAHAHLDCDANGPGGSLVTAQLLQPDDRKEFIRTTIHYAEVNQLKG